MSQLRPYLQDPEPQVRRTALSVLSEAPPSWEEVSPLVADALGDADRSVADMAISLLHELREVLMPSPVFGAKLATAASSERVEVRSAAVGSLWRHRLADLAQLKCYCNDPAAAVRREAVLGMVSLDALEDLGAAATDAASEVRAAVASGLATIGDPRGVTTLTKLAADDDHAVRAAALRAMATTGCPPEAAVVAREALRHPSWEVRTAAATALAAATGPLAMEGLVEATGDANLDVRKAAVRSLAPWAVNSHVVRSVLEGCADDPDADVRAFARIALRDATRPQMEREEI